MTTFWKSTTFKLNITVLLLCLYCPCNDDQMKLSQTGHFLKITDLLNEELLIYVSISFFVKYMPKQFQLEGQY